MAHMNLSKYAEIGRRIREIPLDKPMSSHEREELVHKLCDSDDVHLHERGIKELGDIEFRLWEAGKK